MTYKCGYCGSEDITDGDDAETPDGDLVLLSICHSCGYWESNDDGCNYRCSSIDDYKMEIPDAYVPTLRKLIKRHGWPL